MKKLLLALVLLPFIGFSQNSDSIFIKKMSDDILLNGKAYDWLHHLTKKIGNRISGSLAFAKAIDWGNKTMNEAGADNVILQECKVPHWVRGNGDVVEIISINNQKQKHILHSIALGNSNGGTANANVIAIKNFDELERRKDEIKGKIVFYNYAFNQTYVETFNAYGDAGK